MGLDQSKLASADDDATFKCGWIPDLPPKSADKKYTSDLSGVNVSRQIDLRKYFTEIYDQQNLSTAVICAICSLLDYNCKRKDSKFIGSRLFLYYNLRKTLGSSYIALDTGASIRQAFQALNEYGVCSENEYPYTPDYFTTCPSRKAYNNARFIHAVDYRRIVLDTSGSASASQSTNVRTLKALLSKGYPFIFGFTMYESFKDPLKWNPTSKTMIDLMPYPETTEKIIGYHCVVAIGYSDHRQAFLIQNSWGKSWGNYGRMFMSYKFITSEHCNDFWLLRSIHDNSHTTIVQDDQSYVTLERTKSLNDSKHRSRRRKRSNSHSKIEEKIISLPSVEKRGLFEIKSKKPNEPNEPIKNFIDE